MASYLRVYIPYSCASDGASVGAPLGGGAMGGA